MDGHDITVLVNTGIGGVLLFLYLRQSNVIAALTRELSEVRHEQWELIVRLLGPKTASEIVRNPDRK